MVKITTNRALFGTSSDWAAGVTLDVLFEDMMAYLGSRLAPNGKQRG